MPGRHRSRVRGSTNTSRSSSQQPNELSFFSSKASGTGKDANATPTTKSKKDSHVKVLCVGSKWFHATSIADLKGKLVNVCTSYNTAAILANTISVPVSSISTLRRVRHSIGALVSDKLFLDFSPTVHWWLVSWKTTGTETLALDSTIWNEKISNFNKGKGRSYVVVAVFTEEKNSTAGTKIERALDRLVSGDNEASDDGWASDQDVPPQSIREILANQRKIMGVLDELFRLLKDRVREYPTEEDFPQSGNLDGDVEGSVDGEEGEQGLGSNASPTDGDKKIDDGTDETSSDKDDGEVELPSVPTGFRFCDIAKDGLCLLRAMSMSAKHTVADISIENLISIISETFQAVLKNNGSNDDLRSVLEGSGIASLSDLDVFLQKYVGDRDFDLDAVDILIPALSEALDLNMVITNHVGTVLEEHSRMLAYSVDRTTIWMCLEHSHFSAWMPQATALKMDLCLGCGICVGADDDAVSCDRCELWFHDECLWKKLGLRKTQVSRLHRDKDQSLTCSHCNSRESCFRVARYVDMSGSASPKV